MTTAIGPGGVVQSGDAVSQLVQLALRNAKLGGFNLSGKGHEDVQRVVNYAKNQETAQRELWDLVSFIVKHPLIKAELATNESMQAEVAAHILRARACIDLKNVFFIPNVQPPNAIPYPAA